MSKQPIALALVALLFASGAAPRPARPFDVRWGECMPGTSARLARSYRLAGYPVGGVKGTLQYRWPAFTGTFAGVAGCTIQPLYHVDDMRLEAPVSISSDFALEFVRVELPTLAPTAVPGQAVALFRGMAARLGRPKGIYAQDYLPAALYPAFNAMKRALTPPVAKAMPPNAAAALAAGKLELKAAWELPASDDFVELTTSRTAGVDGHPAPLHLVLEVQSLRARTHGFEAVFTAPGVPRVGDLPPERLTGMETYYEFYRHVVPFHPAGEPVHARHVFDPPPGWPANPPLPTVLRAP